MEKIQNLHFSCLVLDERRIDARKICNFGCVPEQAKDWKPSSNSDPGQVFFADFLAPALSNVKVKIVVILVTLTCLGFGIYGVFNIELDYDPIWFMDQKSYQTKYFKRLHQTFPEHGERIEVYLGEIPYWEQQQELLQIQAVLNSSQYINQDSVQFWHAKFHTDCCGLSPKVFCLDLMDFEGKDTCLEGKVLLAKRGRRPSDFNSS